MKLSASSSLSAFALALLLVFQALAGTAVLAYVLLIAPPPTRQPFKAAPAEGRAKVSPLEGVWEYQLILPPFFSEGTMTCTGATCWGETAEFTCDLSRHPIYCEAVFEGTMYFTGEIVFLSPDAITTVSGLGFGAFRRP